MSSSAGRNEIAQAVESILKSIAGSRWCRNCGDIVETMTIHEAASLTSATLQSIYDWVKAGRVHSLTSQSGLFICSISLQKSEGVTEELDLALVERCDQDK